MSVNFFFDSWMFKQNKPKTLCMSTESTISEPHGPNPAETKGWIESISALNEVFELLLLLTAYQSSALKSTADNSHQGRSTRCGSH